jgi:hypothetical protein
LAKNARGGSSFWWGRSVLPAQFSFHLSIKRPHCRAGARPLWCGGALWACTVRCLPVAGRARGAAQTHPELRKIRKICISMHPPTPGKRSFSSNSAVFPSFCTRKREPYICTRKRGISGGSGFCTFLCIGAAIACAQGGARRPRLCCRQQGTQARRTVEG